MNFVRDAVLVDGVDGGGVLGHLFGDGGVVGWLVGPVVVGAGLAGSVVRVQSRQLEGDHVVDDEVASSGCIQGVQGAEDAINVIRQGVPWDLAVRQVRVDTEIVGPDPHDVDGILASQGRREIRLGGVDLVGHAVVEEGWDLIVDHGGEVGIDAAPYPGCDLVRAYGATDSIVV